MSLSGGELLRPQDRQTNCNFLPEIGVLPSEVTEMKKLNFKNKRIHVLLRTLVAAVGTGFLVTLTTFGSHGTVRVNADNAKGMKIKLYEWYKRDGLYLNSWYPRDPYAMIMWKSGNDVYFMKGSNVGDNDFKGTNINYDPYIVWSYDSRVGDNNKFITRSTDGVPQLIYQSEGKHKDYYGNYYDVHYKLKFENGKYLYTSYWDHLSAEKDGDTWRLLGHDDQLNTGARNYNNSIIYTNPWWFAYDRSAAYDTHINNSGNKVYGRSSKGGWRCGDFWIWTAKEIEYDAIGDTTLDSGQIMTINGNTFLLDGKKLTIKKDAVLCVRGNFYNNGSINCEGTIIVDKNATMIPFSPTGAGGNLTLRGGSLIVSSGAKVLFGLPSGHLNSTSPSCLTAENCQIINYGHLCVGNAYCMNGTELVNHTGASMYLGFSVSGNPSRYLSAKPGASPSDCGLEYDGSFKILGSDVIVHKYEGSTYSTGNITTVMSELYYTDKNGNTTHKTGMPR